MGAPTIQVSHNSVSLESRLVMPVRLNRLARLVPGPEKPATVLLVVDVRTTRPGRRSSWPVEKTPGNGGTLLCTMGPVSCRPLKPAWCRFWPKKSTSMSTNQPNPLAPALAPLSGAKTSILTGLLVELAERCVRVDGRHCSEAGAYDHYDGSRDDSALLDEAHFLPPYTGHV